MPIALALLDNRKLAIVLWAAVAFGFFLTKRDIRRSLLDVIRSACHPAIVALLVSLLLYLGLVVWALQPIDIWTPRLIADTVFWFTGTGLVFAVVAHDRARTDPHFFRRTALRTMTGTVVIAFVVDLHPLPLPAELLLVPFLVLLGALVAFAANRAEFAPVSGIVNSVLGVVGFGLLLRGGAGVANDPAGFASLDSARTLALPAILTITFLPLVYAIAFSASLANLRRQLRFILGSDRALYRYAHRRVLFTIGVRLRAVERAAQAPWRLMLTRPSSRAEIDRVIVHIKRRRPNALELSTPSQNELTRIATEKPEGWEYLLFAARLEAGQVALNWDRFARDRTGREFENPPSRRKTMQRLRQDNDEATALVSDVERILDADEILTAFGAPGEPGNPEHIIQIAEDLIAFCDRLRQWTRRAHATKATSDLTTLLSAHAEMLDLPTRQVEQYIQRWLDLASRLPTLLEDATGQSDPVTIDMALNIAVDEQVLDRFMAEIARFDHAA